MIGPHTAMRHPELFVKCSHPESHDMQPKYVGWWIFGYLVERCTRCGYTNNNAYD